MNGTAPQSFLILVENICLGYQISNLLKKRGRQPYVIFRDYEAYALILRGEAFAVIADIDAPNLGGLSVLTYCHHHYPAIETYAITKSDDTESNQLARQIDGCLGYFYRTDSDLLVDTGRGMAAQLLTSKPSTA